jgi:hypothetical protein
MTASSSADPTTTPRRGRRVPFPPEDRRCPDLAASGARCRNWAMRRGGGRCWPHAQVVTRAWWRERGLVDDDAPGPHEAMVNGILIGWTNV